MLKKVICSFLAVSVLFMFSVSASLAIEKTKSLSTSEILSLSALEDNSLDSLSAKGGSEFLLPLLGGLAVGAAILYFWDDEDYDRAINNIYEGQTQ